jgi:hypothetical protein
MNTAVFEELLHDPALQNITNQNEWAIIQKRPFGLQIIEEFL